MQWGKYWVGAEVRQDSILSSIHYPVHTGISTHSTHPHFKTIVHTSFYLLNGVLCNYLNIPLVSDIYSSQYYSFHSSMELRPGPLVNALSSVNLPQNPPWLSRPRVITCKNGTIELLGGSGVWVMGLNKIIYPSDPLIRFFFIPNSRAQNNFISEMIRTISCIFSLYYKSILINLAYLVGKVFFNLPRNNLWGSSV